MTQAYSNPDREDDPTALPDLEIFELTAAEIAASEQYEDEQHEYLKRFPLATMNSRERERMTDAMIAELGISGGWFYWYCYPGCLPDTEADGPYASYAEAKAAAQENYSL